MGEKNPNGKRKANKLSINDYFSALKSSLAEIGVAFIVTFIVTLIGVLLDITTITKFFVSIPKPYISIGINVFTGLMAILGIIFGAIKLSAYREEDNRVKTIKLLGKEQEFFEIVEQDISTLLKEH